ncbi:MAG: DEAD/DEAH box helicase, partial [Chloroflexi bacterium]|nr:DEAD/DEAH box helicase [Chloroflexota bacterium]
MHIVHGTWIPHEAEGFVQDGAFYLWVETDSPVRHKRRAADRHLHPRHLAHEELGSFLAEKLKITLTWGADINRLERLTELLLPSAGHRQGAAPLPSSELLPYLEESVPEEWALRPWQIYAYPLRDVIARLNDIHFTALYTPEDFQLGADILFWWQYTQELKRLIVADQYIPSLTYRALTPRTKKKGPTFELHAGWAFCSEAYEETVKRYAGCMPPICTGGRPPAGPHEDTRERAAGDDELYDPESLLRHFSECTLHSAVVGTPRTDAFDRQLAGSLLHDCFHPSTPIPGSEEALEQYRRWADWRARLTAGQRDAGFTLCFQLEEPASDGAGDGAEPASLWQLHFLAASKRDPSLRLPLAEYWSLDGQERRTLQRHLGADFERHLLLALGYAARVYPRVWEGLETDRPAGLALTLDETYAFLKEHAWVLEDAGFTVMVPAWWTREGRRRARVRLTTSTRSGSGAAGGAGRAYFSLDTVIDYRYQLSIDGQPITPAEWQQLVEAKTPLVRFRGQWMELNRGEIEHMLTWWQERKQEQPELTLLDLMKLAADQDGGLEWDHDAALRDVLACLQDKSAPEQLDDPANFHGALRDYQKRGVAWLRYLESLHLNPCLADDMGLGKTIQVIAQLVEERNEDPAVPPTLLIAPTSVLGNWRKEVERFAPHLRVLLHHGPARHKDADAFRAACAENDLVVTSFALARMDEKLLRSSTWRRIVVDEAQNIKNPQSAQARAISKLNAQHRLALTGTPVENRLRDLWSIFNFLNPGYLGKEPQFRKAFEIPIQKENDPSRSAALKKLVEPFILRRLKTDRQIIQDLPEKVEQKVYCNLTPEQASLYEAIVKDVEENLEEAEGMQRRGLILATLMKLKQVCNHPAQFLHDGSAFTGERSHKLQRLTEMLEEVLEEGDSALVFTQFTEAGEALERHIRRTLHCNT